MRRKSKNEKWVEQAASVDKTRPHLHKPWIEMYAGKRWLVASDGHRMHLLQVADNYQLAEEPHPDHPNAKQFLELYERALRSGETSKEIVARVEGFVNAKVDSHLQIRVNDKLVQIKQSIELLETLNTEGARDQLEIDMRELKDLFKLYKSQNLGVTTEGLLSKKIGLCAGYIQDALAIDAGTVQITFEGPLDPVWFRFEGPRALAVVMPMRI